MSIKLLEPQKIKEIEIITYRGEGYAFGDYDKVRVMVDGELAVEFGDKFHDQGHKKAESYIQCMKDSGCKAKITEIMWRI